jgi:hypothetical protein
MVIYLRVIPTDELGGWFPPRNRKVLDNRQQEREMQQGRDKRVRDRLASWSGSDANYEHNDNRRGMSTACTPAATGLPKHSASEQNAGWQSHSLSKL